MTIKTKIIIPYVVLFLCVFLLTMIVSLQITSNAVEERIVEQLKNLSTMLSQGGFSMNPALAEKIKSLTGADVIYEYSFQKPLSTMPGTEAGDILPLFKNIAQKPYIFYGGRMKNSEIFFVTVPLPRGATMILIYSADSIYSRKVSATKPILIIGIISLIFMLLFGFIIAHTITKPVYELVRKTSEIAQGRLDVPVEVRGKDELAELAVSFNTMQKGLKKYEMELINSEKLATLGQFSANIAHEIRNPLTSMKMLMQMMETNETNSVKKDAVNIILKEIQRLSIFVEQILDIAHPRKVTLRETDLNVIAKEVISLVEYQAAHLSIKVTASLQKNLPAVKADADRIKHVLMNFVLNAFAAIGEKGEVVIETATAPDGGFVRLAVSDSGSGISEEIKAHLFEPFFSTRQAGTGLGLALCKRIISEHNGEIGFDSKKGKTIFWCKIPL